MQVSNNAAITKIRAIYGKLIKKEEYFEMLNCKKLSEIVEYLKIKSQYKQSLSSLNEHNLNREDLEKTLKNKVFENYAKIYKYCGKNKILRYLVEYFEIVEILNMLSILSNGSTRKYSTNFPLCFISKTKIKFEKVSDLKNLDDLFNVLENTKYIKILKDSNNNSEKNKIDYLKCEHLLYFNFFKKLIRTIEAKSKKIEQAELKKLIKSKIDIINICLIYREKVLFQKNSDLIKEKIFPFHKNLNRQKIEDILNCQTKTQMEDVLKECFSDVKNFILEKIEHTTSKIEFHYCRNKLHISSNMTTTFYCFIILQQIEIANLIAIIEGTHYNMPKETIKDFLIA